MAESIKCYWQMVLRRVRAETQLLQPWRLWTGLGSAVLGPLAQREIGNVAMSVLSTLLLGIVAGVCVYFILTTLTTGELFVRFVAMPAQIWRKDQEAIGELGLTLQKLLSDKWPRLSYEQRQKIADLIRDVPGYFEVWIFSNETHDCADLAADIGDAIERAGWRVLFPPRHQRFPSGIFIHARKGELRANALQAALKQVAALEVRIEETRPSGDATIYVAIGARHDT